MSELWLSSNPVSRGSRKRGDHDALSPFPNILVGGSAAKANSAIQLGGRGGTKASSRGPTNEASPWSPIG